MSNKTFNFRAILFTLFILLSVQQVSAKQLTGFWEIKKVTVGKEEMTPVAKWIKINKEGTFQSGNGWLQNGIGTWEYDQENKVITPETKNGIKEGFGGFQVSFEKDQMIWQRMEEGMRVTVTHIRIDEMPKSPADRIVGLWDLTAATEDGSSILASFDPNNQYKIFIRWDRIYREWTANGKRSSGYWHMHGHKPEITLLSHQKDRDAESWKVEISDTVLTIEGISDSNRGRILTFQRLTEFPK